MNSPFSTWLNLLKYPSLRDHVIALVRQLAYVGAGDHLAVGRRYEADGVADDRLYLRNVVGGEGLVAGLEVEDLAVAAIKETARTEHLATRVRADEEHLVGGRDGEGLAVGLLGGQSDDAVNAARDGVRGLDHPQVFRTNLTVISKQSCAS